MRFTRELIEPTRLEWRFAADINKAMDALCDQRVQTLPVTEHIIRSKIAWKFAVLRQSFTYRLADLGNTTIDQWQQGNTLACIVLGRAFFETVAVLHHITRAMRRHLDSCNLEALNRLAMQGLFGGKNQRWQFGDTDEAINVLTAIKHMDKELPGALSHYGILSEIAHPNSQGGHQFYSTTDAERIEVTFSREKRAPADIIAHVAALMTGALWAVRKFEEFDAMIEEVADLQDPPH
jgi:hypothetical protein